MPAPWAGWFSKREVLFEPWQPAGRLATRGNLGRRARHLGLAPARDPYGAGLGRHRRPGRAGSDRNGHSTRCRNRTRAAVLRDHRGPLVPVHAAEPGSVVDPLAPDSVPESLSTLALCSRWQRSYFTLTDTTDPAERAHIVALRGRYLDELERRDPGAVVRWLGTDDRPPAPAPPATSARAPVHRQPTVPRPPRDRLKRTGFGGCGVPAESGRSAATCSAGACVVADTVVRTVELG